MLLKMDYLILNKKTIMIDFLKFAWESLIHPTSLLDLLAPFQLLLALICWFYIGKAFIEIYKFKKNK